MVLRTANLKRCSLWPGKIFFVKFFSVGTCSSRQENKPFFLYYAIHDIHVPRMPATQFKGKSRLGYRGDAILEMDHTVGIILDALQQRGLLDHTLIIFSSDNGPVLNDGYLDSSVETAAAAHYSPSGIYRGGKYSVLEGGTRVPFIACWANRIKPPNCFGRIVQPGRPDGLLRKNAG
jgi:arylsulfatase A-like enzyme